MNKPDTESRIFSLRRVSVFPFRLVVILALFVGSFLQAQESVAELQKQIPSASGRHKVDLLNSLAFAHWNIDPKAGIDYGREALDLAKKLRYDNGMARALNVIGLNCSYLGNYAGALENYKESLRISEAINDKSIISNTLNNLGIVYTNLGNYELALEYFYRTLKIKQDIGDSYAEARVLNNLGEIHLNLKNYDQALPFLEKSLVIKRGNNNDQAGEATTLHNMGTLYRLTNKTQTALGYYQQALAISTERGQKNGMAESIFGLGELFSSQKDYRRALEYYQQSLAIREDIGEQLGMASCLNKIGFTQIRIGDYDNALRSLERATRIAESIAAKPELQNNLQYLAELYAAQGRYFQATQFFKDYDKIKDQIYNEDRARKIANLNIVYETQQKEKAIEIQRLKIERQRSLQYFFIVGILLVLVVMFFIYSRYRLKAKINVQLAELNRKLDLLARLDPLTDLPNRRAFMEKANYERTRYQRSRRAFSIILADIDNFKTINDQFGHECGDTVLRFIAERIKCSIRALDVPARWGGEEFILLLPETDGGGGVILAERIRAAVAEGRVDYGDESVQVTLTLGVSAYREDRSVEEIIAQADQALYKGKSAGKNQVILLESSPV